MYVHLLVFFVFHLPLSLPLSGSVLLYTTISTNILVSFFPRPHVLLCRQIKSSRAHPENRWNAVYMLSRGIALEATSHRSPGTLAAFQQQRTERSRPVTSTYCPEGKAGYENGCVFVLVFENDTRGWPLSAREEKRERKYWRGHKRRWLGRLGHKKGIHVRMRDAGWKN